VLSLLRAVLVLSFLLTLTNLTSAADRAIIVLDASNSMWGRIDGQPKLEIARDVLETVLHAVPAATELGFMAYGHRRKGSCDDIELIVPPAAGTGGLITAAANTLKFQGRTPLTAAVKQAAEALRYTEDEGTVILITDGLETCNADPCAAAKALEAAGVNFTVHVVGFGLTKEEGRKVACLAENTGGRYIQAANARELTDALASTVAAEPAPAPPPPPEPAAKPAFNFAPDAALTETGPSLDRDAGNAWEIYRSKPGGGRGEWVGTEYGNDYKTTLQPGAYQVVARLGEASVEHQVSIEAGSVAKPRFVLNAGTLIVTPLASEGDEPDRSATVEIEHPGGARATTYGLTRIVLPAGEQKLTVKIGSGAVTETVAVGAGETVVRKVVVGVGHVVLNAFYVPGMKVEESGLDVKIFKAVKRIDGTREQIAYGFGPNSRHDVPPGEYVLVARMDQAEAEQPFTIKSGEQNAADAVLQAGVLAVSAPGAKRIVVYGAAKDIQGKRKEFGSAYDAKHQTTLPAGDYAVVAERADGISKERSVSVRAGERTELTIE
jgi:Ca-activated chloride channel homolog